MHVQLPYSKQVEQKFVIASSDKWIFAVVKWTTRVTWIKASIAWKSFYEEDLFFIKGPQKLNLWMLFKQLIRII